MAHLRRRLVDAIDAGGAPVASLLADIGKLYGLEKRAREAGFSDTQRAYLRHAYARPILKSLQQRFAALKDSELPSGALGKAAAYAVNHWPQIARYAKARFGHVNIDNNPIERGIRPTKLGMKNWLFIGHPAAGWRSAVIYSITGATRRRHQSHGEESSAARLRRASATELICLPRSHPVNGHQ
jgi:transposase